MRSSLRDTGDVLPGPQEFASSRPRAGRVLRALLLAIACAVLVGSYLVAGIVYERADELRTAQLAQRTAVTATIVELTPNGERPGPAVAARSVCVRWTAPDSTTSTSKIFVEPSATIGDQYLIWTTSSGQAVSSPITRTQTALLGLGAGVGISGGALALAIVAYRLPRRVAARQRMRALDAEWADVEPQWSRR